MNKLEKEDVIGISALLVHAANIDEIYSDHEKNLVKDFIKSYLKDEEASEILKKAEEVENNSNQLLNYTNIIKEKSIEIKKDKSEDTYIFRGEKKTANKIIKFDKKENPFKKLLTLNLK